MISCQCNCGAVAFELASVPTAIYVCHCSICRRLSGGNGMAVVVIENGRFTWLQGQEHIRIWKKPDADWEANFCGQCGSNLPGRNDPERMFVPAGLLPGDLPDLEVKHHIFVGSKASWDVIGDAGKQHDGPFVSD